MSTCCCRRIELAEEGREAGLDKETREWLRLVFAGLVAGQSMIFGLAASMSPPEGVARWVIHGSLAFGAIAVF
ncbi:MAG: hypothetical protein NZL93_06265, partial [Chthoniobacterales bacterium]|nr:hypothetical protein [Chthoniobacterales bacterium]